MKPVRLLVATIIGGLLLVRSACPVVPMEVRRDAVVEAVEKAGPAVVNMSTERVLERRIDPFSAFTDPFFESFFQDFYRRFGYTERFKTTSLGSGVIIDPDGYIVTNEHVIRKASKITVRLPGQGEHLATLLNSDVRNDLALLKVESDRPFPYVSMGTSADLMMGEKVIAMGNPFGLENSVSTGVISGKNRSVAIESREAYSGLLQTDAAINPGNSGGALLNVGAELVGINTAIYEGGQGIGFAIPVDRVKELLTELFDFETAKGTWLGLAVVQQGSSLVVSEVVRGSPAARAGISVGDTLVAANGRRIASLFDYRRAIFPAQAGDTVEIQVDRAGAAKTFLLTVGRKPVPLATELALEKLGIEVVQVSAALARRHGLPVEAGIMVRSVQPKSPAADAGIRPQDIVLACEGRPTDTLEQLRDVLAGVKSGEQIGVRFLRGQFVVEVPLIVR